MNSWSANENATDTILAVFIFASQTNSYLIGWIYKKK
jgi:hypothetical protein